MEDQRQEQIGVKEAVQRAIQTVQDLYEDTPLGDLLLEEVELAGRNWLVTLSFTRPGRGMAIGTIMGPSRAFKRVKIDASTGEFQGMEIRELPATPQSERRF